MVQKKCGSEEKIKIKMQEIHDKTWNFYVYKDDYKSKHKNNLSEKWYRRSKFYLDMKTISSISFDEKLIWQNISEGRSIMLSGQAGSGKSFLLQQFIEHLKMSNCQYEICGTTAVSAVNINGRTLHSALGLGLAKESFDELKEKIQHFRRKMSKTVNFLKNTDILVIDEISMCDPEFFTKLNLLFQHFRECDLPFGGIILIMVGDFTQLGPVKNSKCDARFIFQTYSYQQLPISRLFLLRNYRQKSHRFLELLNNVRRGKITDEDDELLRSRINQRTRVENLDKRYNMKDYIYHLFAEDSSDVEKYVTLNNNEQMKLKSLCVYTHRDQVKAKNNKELQLFTSKGCEIRTFRPIINTVKKTDKACIPTSERENILKMVKNGYIEKLFPVYFLELCIGCQVMLRCNSYIHKRLYNGSIGLVTDIGFDDIKVLFVQDGKLMTDPISIQKTTFTASGGPNSVIELRQYPLSIAYGSTIHKVQGLTLDSARISIGNCFQPGQGYTGLSRVPTLEDLSLIDYNKDNIKAHKDAVAFEEVTQEDM